MVDLKTLLYTTALFLLIGLVGGFFLGRATTKTKTVPVQVAFFDTSTAISAREPGEPRFPIRVGSGEDTSEYGPETPVGEVPPRDLAFEDSLPFLLNDSLRQLHLGVKLCGLVGTLDSILLATHSGRFYTQAPAPPEPGLWDFRLYGIFYTDRTLDLLALLSYRRVGLAAKLGTERLSLDEETRTAARLGLTIRIW